MEKNLALFAAVLCLSLGFFFFGLHQTTASDISKPFSFWMALGLSAGWIPALGAGFWLAWRPARPLGILLFLCAAASDNFETAYIDVANAKLYYYDILLGAALLGVMIRAAANRRLEIFPKTTINVPLLVFSLAGIVFFWRGLDTVVTANDALGDLRRGYFYPLVFFLALWETSQNRRAWIWIAGGLLAGAALQIVEGFTGIFMRNFRQLHFADVFHILSHYSTTMLSIIFYAGLAMLIYQGAGRAKRWAFTALGAVVLLILIANFRSAWLGLAAGTGICLLRSGFRLSQLRRFALPLAAGLALAAVAFLVLGNIEIAPGATLKGEVLSKFSKLINYERDPNTIWRLASYKAALIAWSEHPILGVGLGNFLTFYVPGTFGGQYLSFGHRVHNSYLWYIYSAGIVGFGLFLWIQINLFRTLWSGVRKVQSDWLRIWVLALLGFYVHFLVTTSFHHLFESSVTTLVLYTAAGFTCGAIALEQANSSGSSQHREAPWR